MVSFGKKNNEEGTFTLLFGSPPTSDAMSVPDWGPDGKLAVDIAETDTEVIVISTIAGALFDKIEVYLHNDLLTIRGERQPPALSQEDMEYVLRECFWGNFSRSIVLPTEVKGELARADYKNGILTIIIPKRKTDARIHVRIVEE